MAKRSGEEGRGEEEKWREKKRGEAMELLLTTTKPLQPPTAHVNKTLFE